MSPRKLSAAIEGGTRVAVAAASGAALTFAVMWAASDRANAADEPDSTATADVQASLADADLGAGITLTLDPTSGTWSCVPPADGGAGSTPGDGSGSGTSGGSGTGSGAGSGSGGGSGTGTGDGSGSSSGDGDGDGDGLLGWLNDGPLLRGTATIIGGDNDAAADAQVGRGEGDPFVDVDVVGVLHQDN